MPNEYEGETCASCLGLNTIRPQCRATGEVRDALSPVCDDFGPGWMTPAVRIARALEKLAECVASDGVFNTYENFK